MTADPRAALETLTAALERHLEVATSRQDPDDPTVVAAAQDLAEAFDDYDEALFRATEVATPLAIYDGSDEDDEDEDEDEDDDLVEDGSDDEGPVVYSGFDDVDLDDDDEEVEVADDPAGKVRGR